VQLFAGFTDNKPVVIGSSENINRFMCEYKPSWLVYFNIYTSKVFQWLNPACLKKNWHSLIPCDDVIVIDNLKNLKHDFSSLLLYFPTDTRLGFQTQNRNFKISLFVYIRTIIGGFIIVQKRRTYISPIQLPRWNAYHRLHRIYRLLFFFKPSLC